jgi:hypothetical protein
MNSVYVCAMFNSKDAFVCHGKTAGAHESGFHRGFLRIAGADPGLFGVGMTGTRCKTGVSQKTGKSVKEVAPFSDPFPPMTPSSISPL